MVRLLVHISDPEKSAAALPTHSREPYHKLGGGTFLDSAMAKIWYVQAIRERSDLDTQEKLLLIFLWSYADDNGGNCYPSILRLSVDTRMCEKTVRTRIHTLESKGLMTITKSGRSYHYQLMPVADSQIAVRDSTNSGRGYRTPKGRDLKNYQEGCRYELPVSDYDYDGLDGRPF